MIKYTDTTVFNVGAQTIVNTINCVGVMGAGLALEFQLRFPEMEKDYVERCKAKKVQLGRPYLYRDNSCPWILNFPTKNHWKHPSQLEWIEQGLQYIALNYQKGGIASIAFPKLGCSNGGLDWGIVRPLMEQYLQDLDIDVFLCEDTEKEASGVEGKMVKMLNHIESHPWADKLNLRSNSRKKIIAALPIYRFRELRKIEGIGKQTYKEVFGYLYSLADRKDTRLIQSACQNKISSSEELNTSLLVGDSLGNLKISSALSVHSQNNYLNEVENLKTNASNAGKNLSNFNSEIYDKQRTEYDAFYICLPYLEKLLMSEQKKSDIANYFKLPQKTINEWLNKAEKLGKIKKTSHRPIKYITISSISNEQLEMRLNS